MQVTATNYLQRISTPSQSGSKLPSVGESEPANGYSLIQELSKIDPTDMSRNDARTIADALMKSGDGELSIAFMSQSMTLKVNADGSVSTPSNDDPIMTKKFNMFDSLKGQMEFNRNHNLSTEALEKAEHFLQKLQIAKITPRIDTYT